MKNIDRIMETASLLGEIELFLDETGMSATYFGRLACGNQEVVGRLRTGGEVTLSVGRKILSFIEKRRSQKIEADQ